MVSPDRDIIDNLSTLFAVRVPGEPAAASDRAISIQRLFSERFLHREPKPDRDLLYLHGGEHASGLPYGSRSMPAFPGDG